MYEKEEISTLKEKVAKYEGILEKVLDHPKQVATVVSGPYTDEKGMTYRVEVNSNSMLVGYSKSLIFGKIRDEKLEPGMEVVLIDSAIVAIMPEPLRAVEKTPEFKLVGWNQIGGLSSQVNRIREAIELPMKHADLSKELGLSPIKGALLYGPPGCGKTLIAKAIASSILGSECVDQRAFTYVKGGSLLSSYVGATEQRIVSMFKEARKYTEKTGNRAVIFIDEAEAILPTRGSRVSSDVDTTIVPTFLAEMDGFEGSNPFMLLSTNHPNQIDAAILREGRIDIKIEVARPNQSDLKDIFMIHFDKVKCADKKEALATKASELVFEDASITPRASGSLAETIVKLSAQKALSRKIAHKKTVTGVNISDVVTVMQSLT